MKLILIFITIVFLTSCSMQSSYSRLDNYVQGLKLSAKADSISNIEAIKYIDSLTIHSNGTPQVKTIK